MKEDTEASPAIFRVRLEKTKSREWNQWKERCGLPNNYGFGVSEEWAENEMPLTARSAAWIAHPDERVQTDAITQGGDGSGAGDWIDNKVALEQGRAPWNEDGIAKIESAKAWEEACQAVLEKMKEKGEIINPVTALLFNEQVAACAYIPGSEWKVVPTREKIDTAPGVLRDAMAKWLTWVEGASARDMVRIQRIETAPSDLSDLTPFKRMCAATTRLAGELEQIKKIPWIWEGNVASGLADNPAASRETLEYAAIWYLDSMLSGSGLEAQGPDYLMAIAARGVNMEFFRREFKKRQESDATREKKRTLDLISEKCGMRRLADVPRNFASLADAVYGLALALEGKAWAEDIGTLAGPEFPESHYALARALEGVHPVRIRGLSRMDMLPLINSVDAGVRAQGIRLCGLLRDEDRSETGRPGNEPQGARDPAGTAQADKDARGRKR